MLVIRRKPNESIVVNENVIITVLRVDGGTVRFGIDAPKDVPVHRQEVRDAIVKQLLEALGASRGPNAFHRPPPCVYGISRVSTFCYLVENGPAQILSARSIKTISAVYGLLAGFVPPSSQSDHDSAVASPRSSLISFLYPRTIRHWPGFRSAPPSICVLARVGICMFRGSINGRPFSISTFSTFEKTAEKSMCMIPSWPSVGRN